MEVDPTSYYPCCSVCKYFSQSKGPDSKAAKTSSVQFMENSEADSIWSRISKGIVAVLADPYNVDRKTYVQVYEAAYVFVRARTDAAGGPHHHLAHDMFHYLYERLDDLLVQYVSEVAATMSAADSKVALYESPAYATEWERYVKATEVNTHLFSSVQEFWVVFNHRQGVEVLSIRK